MAALRVCFIGDSIVQGTLDPEGRGWPGRLVATGTTRETELTAYNLGIRGDTSDDIRRRWRDEATRRLPPGLPGAIVFGFGLNDTLVREDGAMRVPLERSIENASVILREAADSWPALVIGPAPVDDTRPTPATFPGPRWHGSNARLHVITEQLGSVATQFGVPFLPTMEPLLNRAAWVHDLLEGDGIHPSSAGYAALAELVDGWHAWRALLKAPRAMEDQGS